MNVFVKNKNKIGIYEVIASKTTIITIYLLHFKVYKYTGSLTDINTDEQTDRQIDKQICDTYNWI